MGKYQSKFDKRTKFSAENLYNMVAIISNNVLSTSKFLSMSYIFSVKKEEKNMRFKKKKQTRSENTPSPNATGKHCSCREKTRQQLSPSLSSAGSACGITVYFVAQYF